MTKKIKLLKDFTYYSLIKDAIYNAPCNMATSNDIFNYFVLKYPNLFKESNSMTWKGNIRQVLSKHPEFIKLRKFNNSKQHFWTHKCVEELENEEKLMGSCLKTQELNSEYFRNTNKTLNSENGEFIDKAIIDNRIKHMKMSLKTKQIYSPNDMDIIERYEKEKNDIAKIEKFITKMEELAKEENISVDLLEMIRERRNSRALKNAEDKENQSNRVTYDPKSESIHGPEETVSEIKESNIFGNLFSDKQKKSARSKKPREHGRTYWDFNDESIYKKGK